MKDYMHLQQSMKWYNCEYKTIKIGLKFDDRLCDNNAASTAEECNKSAK